LAWAVKTVSDNHEQLKDIDKDAVVCMTPLGEPYALVGKATSKKVQEEVVHCVELFLEHGSQLFKNFLRGRFESRKKRTVREMAGNPQSSKGLKDSFDYTWEAMRDWNLFMKYERVVMDYIQQRCMCGQVQGEKCLSIKEMRVYKLDVVDRNVAMSKTGEEKAMEVS
jgi:hypothetical protein